MKKKYLIISTVCIAFSSLVGVFTKDPLLGNTILATGLLNAYFASEGKKINYIFGLINYSLMSYVSFQNHLFGIFFFYLCIFAPLQIKGFLTWNKNLDKEENVKVREFTLKNSMIITLSCLLGSLLLGYLLTLIPNQQLAILDASSNCINLCGIVLMILRFKESWWLWLINNIIDLIIWIIVVINDGSNSLMMLLTSIGYLVINIYGVIMWNKKAKKEKEYENCTKS